MAHSSTAKAVRENKERHPENYCSAKNCLWNTRQSPCKKHPLAPIHMGRVFAGERGDELAFPEVGE